MPAKHEFDHSISRPLANVRSRKPTYWVWPSRKPAPATRIAKCRSTLVFGSLWTPTNGSGSRKLGGVGRSRKVTSKGLVWSMSWRTESARRFIPRTSRVPFPTLYVGRKPAETSDARLLPLVIVLRPFARSFYAFERQSLSIAGVEATDDRQSVIVVDYPGGRVWVDNRRDCVPIRYTLGKPPAVRMDTSIRYEQDVAHGWIPESWNTVYIADNGTIQHSIALTVTKRAINQALPTEVFDIEVPVGAWVSDSSTKESYIVREGGRKRPILAGEFNGHNFEQLLATDPPSDSAGTTKVVVLLVALGLLALLAAAGVYRMTRASRQSAGSKQ